MATLTKEEEYFLRMLKLVNGVAPKAVRDKFDQCFPPANWPSLIKQKENSIRRLGYINSAQMSKLFPINGVTSSSEYDVTLMICLIRNFAPVRHPINGFDILPPSTEKHDGADLARIKYYRNYLAHCEKDTLTSSEFTLMWATLTEAIIRLGGITYKDDCDRLINLNLNNDIIINLRQELQEIRAVMSTEISKVKKMTEKCSCHDFHQIVIEEWEKKNQKFIIIDALDSLFKHIKEKKRVTVTGIPGVGKSALIQHVALSLRDQEGYDIIPCRNPSEIQTHFKKERLQVFVVNDVCGRYILNQYETDEWKKCTPAILTILAEGSTIFLFSCRLQIFRENSFKTLELFSHFYDLSSCKFKISLDKKIEIAEQYLPSEIVASINEELENCEMVPLLCSLGTRYSEMDVSLFFTNPVEVYNDELKEMNNESDKTKFCSLFFSLVYNGSISIEAIKLQSRQRLEEVFETFGVNRGTCTKTIIENLDSFNGTYLTKCGDEYKVIHDKLFDIFCAYFGKHYQETLIKFAHNKVIYERTWLKLEEKSKLSGDHSLTIFVDNCYENDYFSRILADIRNGNVIDVLYSQQMEHVNFRARLVSFMQEQDRREIKSLLYVRDNIQTGGVDTIVHIVCALGYDDLFQFFLTFIDDANIFASDEFPPLHQACYHGNHIIVQSFIDKGADLNSSALYGLPPLIWACIGEQLHIVELLLNNKADVNVCVSDRSPIFEACSIKNTNILDTLITWGANIHVTDSSGKTPIIRCAQNGHDRHVAILVSRCIDNEKQIDDNGMTGLSYACEYGHIEIVKLLIEAGCETKSVPNNCILPPLVAARRGQQMEIINFLLDMKVDVNISSESGWTALMEACEIGDDGLIRVLLENGASVNQPDVRGKSPLMLASEKSDTIAVQILIECGADVNQTDANGLSAFMFACDNMTLRVIELLGGLVDISHVLEDINGEMALFRWLKPKYKKVVQLLFKLRLDINVKNSHGHTPLEKAISLGKYDASRYLVEKGANINLFNKKGHTPFHEACIYQQYRLISYFVDIGANVKNSTRNENNSALHLLCLNYKCKNDDNCVTEAEIISNSNKGHRSSILLDNDVYSEEFVISLLLNEGLNINGQNRMGQTPLMIACLNKNDHLARFLESKGAKKDVNILAGLEDNESLRTYRRELVDESKVCVSYEHKNVANLHDRRGSRRLENRLPLPRRPLRENLGIITYVSHPGRALDT